MVYFKQHFESCNKEWVDFGTYSDFDIQPEGDVLCEVRSVISEGMVEPIRSCIYKEYVEPGRITIIDKEEYDELLDLWNKASKLQLQVDEIMREILSKCKASVKTNIL